MTIVIHPEDLSEDAAFAVPVREALHSDPEIGLHLPKTEARILAALKALKIDDVHTNIGGGKRHCGHSPRNQTRADNCASGGY